MLDGALHVTTISRLVPDGALTRAGAPGTVEGVALRTLDALELPAADVATTDAAYVVPLTSPVIVHDVVLAPVVHDTGVAPPVRVAT